MAKVDKMNKEKIKYKAKGVVLGNLWGGGKGFYTARTLEAENLSNLKAQIIKGIKTGSLDSGMGYESLIGAVMEITKITEVIIEGKPFINKEAELKSFSIPTEFEEEAENFLYASF